MRDLRHRPRLTAEEVRAHLAFLAAARPTTRTAQPITRREFWDAVGEDGRAFLRELGDLETGCGPLELEAAWRE